MPSEAIWLILFIVAMLAAPFATLRALGAIRDRRRRRQRQRENPPEDEQDPDKPSGFW